MQFKKYFLVLALILQIIFSVHAQTNLPTGLQFITSVEGVSEYRLSNGMKILLIPDPTKQTITTNLTYLVGSRHEGYGEKGMAHLLEHLLFKGSTNYPDILSVLNARGISFNGTTDYDRTNYIQIMPAKSDNLNTALQLEADRMVNSFVAKADLDKEMTVVRNEFESGENGALLVLQKRLLSTAYMWHNYGNVTIGARSDIENVPIENLQAFYRKFYQPDNAVLLVSGKFNETETLTTITRTFGIIPRPTRPLPTTYTVEPAQDGERQVILRRVGGVPTVYSIYHIPGGSHPDYPAVKILSNILGDFQNGRLIEGLVNTKMAISAGAWERQLSEPSFFTTSAQVENAEKLQPVAAELNKLVETFANQLPTADEVNRAKRIYSSEAKRMFGDTTNLSFGLSDWIGMGDWRLFFLNRDRIQNVTAEDVQRVAAKYLIPSNRTTGFYYPSKELPVRAEIPANQDVNELVDGYKGNSKFEIGEAFEPTPENIESRLVRTTLKNGMKIGILPKRNRGNHITLQMVFHLGNETALMGKDIVGTLTAKMLQRGTIKRTKERLREDQGIIESTVNINGDATKVTLDIATNTDNLSQALEMGAEIMREPRFDAEELEQVKRELSAQVEASKNQPDYLAEKTLSQNLNPFPKGHPLDFLDPETALTEIKSVTVDDVKKFHEDFYGSSFAEMAIVGNVTTKDLTGSMETLFGNWNNKTPYRLIVNNYSQNKPVNESINTPDKANAFFLAAQLVKMNEDNPDYPAMTMVTYMLGGGILQSRLALRIRKRDGLSYSIGANLLTESINDKSIFRVLAITAPQNIEKVESAFKEEINRVLKDGFEEEEFNNAKNGWLEARKVLISSDRGIAGKLIYLLNTGKTMSSETELQNRIKSLTLEQANSALRKYIELNKFSIVKAGELKKNQ